MAASEGRIKALMDFLVNVMGFKASFVAKQPYLLGLSLEKRIVPRGLFVKDLISKGILAKVSGLTTLFASSEKDSNNEAFFSYHNAMQSCEWSCGASRNQRRN
ncbi:uncharacterized protein LOC128032723 [Gossypium raimondii]|uniref:uncharacterized protein LOC128032723 n=1 Tax=Gossypium raimondii TaxID=29730 RepID=UPI00227CEFA7|nr:uncharacterized protein LOC128032723 [Gossypium raimondii]